MSTRYKAGLKAHRQSVARRGKNRMERSGIRTWIKKTEAAAKEGNEEKIGDYYKKMVSAIDKGVKHGLLHVNMAARKKSRMHKLVSKTLNS